jgi:hemerythrin
MLWNKSYETGNLEVDNEHKQLFALVQKVIDAAFTNRDEKIETTMNFLADYTIKHFAHEERLMDESSYPEAVTHKTQHKNFLSSVGELRERIRGENDTLKSSLDINKVIVDWLTEHVLGSDRLLANHYRKWSEAK